MAGSLQHGRVHEGVTRSIGELHEPEALFAVEPVHGRLDRRTGCDRRRLARCTAVGGPLTGRCATAAPRRRLKVVVEPAAARFTKILVSAQFITLCPNQRARPSCNASRPDGVSELYSSRKLRLGRGAASTTRLDRINVAGPAKIGRAPMCPEGASWRRLNADRPSAGKRRMSRRRASRKPFSRDRRAHGAEKTLLCMKLASMDCMRSRPKTVATRRRVPL